MVGQLVDIKTSRPELRYHGVLCAVDPESGSLGLLTEPGPCTTLITGHTVAEVVPSTGEISGALASAYQTISSHLENSSPSVGDEDEDEDGGSSQRKAEEVAEFLRSMRISARVEMQGQNRAVNVLDGVAYVFKPFCADSCQSTNETVLARLRSILNKYSR